MTATQLSKVLRPNLLNLSNLIARKPPAFDARWARTISETFTLYTRTSTVNLFLAIGNRLAEDDWPFPTFIDLECELRNIGKDFRPNIPLLRRFIGRSSLSIAIFRTGTSGFDAPTQRQMLDSLMCKRFKKAADGVFSFWLQQPLLQSRKAILQDVMAAYRRRLWGVCTPGLLPILDFIIRHCLKTDSLRISVGTVAEGFRMAGISPEALKPGAGIWDAEKAGVGPVINDIGHDLRLPGLYLSSFVEFAQKFYARHSAASGKVTLNRHAALHGDVEYWSEIDTVKLLMFFDLTIKLEPVLEVVLKTEEGAG